MADDSEAACSAVDGSAVDGPAAALWPEAAAAHPATVDEYPDDQYQGVPHLAAPV